MQVMTRALGGRSKLPARFQPSYSGRACHEQVRSALRLFLNGPDGGVSWQHAGDESLDALLRSVEDLCKTSAPVSGS